MTTRPTCKWTGVSGKEYEYSIFERNPSIKSGQHGNYIYTKVVNNTWVPVYFGEGDLSARCTQSHHQIRCIDSKGATHVHMHLNSNAMARSAEESDLLAGHPNAYVPTGCNVNPGG